LNPVPWYLDNPASRLPQSVSSVLRRLSSCFPSFVYIDINCLFQSPDSAFCSNLRVRIIRFRCATPHDYCKPVFVYMYAYTHIYTIYAYIHIHTCACVYAHACMCACECIYVCTLQQPARVQGIAVCRSVSQCVAVCCSVI